MSPSPVLVASITAHKIYAQTHDASTWCIKQGVKGVMSKSLGGGGGGGAIALLAPLLCTAMYIANYAPLTTVAKSVRSSEMMVLLYYVFYCHTTYSSMPCPHNYKSKQHSQLFGDLYHALLCFLVRGRSLLHS